MDSSLQACAKATVFCWLAGLAYAAYASDYPSLVPLGWIALVVVGMFAASLLFGAGFAMLGWALQRGTGLPLFGIALNLAPIAALVSAPPVAAMVAGWLA